MEFFRGFGRLNSIPASARFAPVSLAKLALKNTKPKLETLQSKHTGGFGEISKPSPAPVLALGAPQAWSCNR